MYEAVGHFAIAYECREGTHYMRQWNTTNCVLGLGVWRVGDVIFLKLCIELFNASATFLVAQNQNKVSKDAKIRNRYYQVLH